MNKEENSGNRLKQLLYTLGKSYLERQQFQEADEKLSQLIEIDAENPEFCLYAAVARIGLEDVSQESLELYERAVKLNPYADVLIPRLNDLLDRKNVVTPFSQMLRQQVNSGEDNQDDDVWEAPPNGLSKGRTGASCRDQLEALWWNCNFQDAKDKLSNRNNGHDSSISQEMAFALTHAYEHLADAQVVTDGQTSSAIALHLCEMQPLESLDAFLDYLTLRLSLPEGYRLRPANILSTDTEEYAFILGMVPMEDFFGELQSKGAVVDNQATGLQDKQILEMLEKPESSEAGSKPLTSGFSSFMVANLKRRTGDAKISDRLVNLISSHFAAIPESLLRQAGTGYIDLANEPANQLQTMVRLLRSLDQYNAAAALDAQVILECAILVDDDNDGTMHNDRWSMMNVLKAGNILQNAAKDPAVKSTSGKILFAGSVASREKLRQAGFFMKRTGVATMMPGSNIECSEVLWQPTLESASSDNPFALGDMEVRDRIGSHQGSSTFVARNKQLGRVVLLKALNHNTSQEYLHNDLKRQKLYSDIRNIGRLSHPNIATLFDMGESDATIYFTREFIEGTQISDLDYSNPEWELELSNHMLKMIRALSYVHSQDQAHLNLKPNNIWLNESQGLKITDFYIRAFGTRDDEDLSWQYKAPEFLASGQGDARSDIYSIGVICSELLCQIHPYRALGIEKIEDLKKKPSIKPQPKAASFHEGWLEIVTKCMKRQPSRRYQDAAELMVAIRQLQLDLLPK